MQEANTEHTANSEKLDSPHPEPLSTYQKSFVFNSALGGISALMMEGFLHPIDTVRTRLKANIKAYVPFSAQVTKMYIKEGPRSYFRGFTCTLYGSFIANGSYFFIYEKLKHILNNKQILSENISPFIAAFVGGFMSDFIYLPFDVIRTRMQLKPGVYDYKDFFDGAKKVVKHEGVKTLYLGWPVFFTLSAVLTSLTFGFYEIFHKVLKPIFPTKHDVNVPLSICSSICASALAAFLTNPLDVLVTRMQSVNTSVRDPYTIPELIGTILEKEGIPGFMKGVTGTVSYYAIGAVILFPTYEILKGIFHVDLRSA